MKQLSVSERRNQKSRVLILLIVIIGSIGILSIVITSHFTKTISVSNVSIGDSETGVLVKYKLKNRTNKSQVVTLDVILYSRDMSLFPKVPDAVLVSGKSRVTLSMRPKEVRTVETIVPAILPVVSQSVAVVSCRENGK